jgi:tetratricopeptide (TPR) repeat protein
MACAFERKNNWAIAKKWFIKALKIIPNDVNTLYALGLVSYKLGEYGDSKFFALNAIEQNPD